MKRVVQDETMQRVLEMWLLMKVQMFLYEQVLMMPSEVDLMKVWTMLDVACGSGQWVRDMATWSPEMTVVGIDWRAEVIEQARYLSDVWRLRNTAFLVGDMFHMTEIEDNSFDLVHARFLGPVVMPRTWTVLLQECLRVCRVGGIVVWTEASFPRTNSAACQQWWRWMEEAIVGMGTTPDVTFSMERLVRDVIDWRNGDDENRKRVRRVEKTLDVSAGAPLHERMYRHIPASVRHTKPMLLDGGVAGEQEIEEVCQKMVIDLYSDTFEEMWTLITLVVEKSES